MGHPLLSMNPFLFTMSTLFVRGHNRVCDMLIQKWPTWTDDEIYNTAKRIVVGEMMGIMINDIINVHMEDSFSLKYRPEVYQDRLQNISSSSTPIELLMTTLLPVGLPDKWNDKSIESTLFSDNGQVFMEGMSDTVQFMVNQKIGMITHNNDGIVTEPLTQLLLKMSRENSLQSFNNYRRRLGLNPYKSMYDLTQNWEIANILNKLYNDVEDVEMLTGMLTENKSNGVVPTFTVMTNSFIINSILTNYLTSKNLWKSDTFGGSDGFSKVKYANIKTFVYNNLNNNCDGLKVELYAK